MERIRRINDVEGSSRMEKIISRMRKTTGTVKEWRMAAQAKVPDQWVQQSHLHTVGCTYFIFFPCGDYYVSFWMLMAPLYRRMSAVLMKKRINSFQKSTSYVLFHYQRFSLISVDRIGKIKRYRKM